MTPASPTILPPSASRFTERVRASLRAHGDRIFLRHIDSKGAVEELSFRDFFLQSLVTAGLYDHFSIPVGGTVVLILSNPKEVFLAVAGALLTGRIPIVSAHPSPKLSLADFSRTLLPLINNANPALIVGDPEYCSYISGSIGRRVASLQDSAMPEMLPQVIASDNPILFIQYSSGTTGAKKGVAISPRQLLWQIDAYAKAIGLNKDDHIVSWLPYYHDMGLLTALMMPLVTGTPVTIMSAFDWVKNPLMLLRAMARYRGTLTWLPNFAYNFLAQAARRADLEDLDLSAVRGVVNCSEPVAAASHDLFLKTFAPHGFQASALAASYAMAETTFAITSGGFGDPLRLDRVERGALTIGAAVSPGAHEIVASGRILPGTELHIFDRERRVLGERHVGEIAVRSPSLMNGYFKNTEATVNAHVGKFFLTGDLGYVDNGHVFVTGRIKDLIITAGRNIYPQDIESVVNDISHVIPGRCVAFGIADESKGTENVVIVAERTPESNIDNTKISVAISRAVSARFDISIADVLIVDAGWLRKSTSGKIARGQNRNRYLEHKAQVSAEPAAEHDASGPQDVIRRCIHDVIGIWVEDAAAPLVTSGLVDSLALTNLMLALEEAFKKAVPMPDEVGYDAYDNIAAIAQVIASEYKPKDPDFVFVIDREVKANYVLEGPRDFDSLILGSSRSYLIQAKRAATHGLNAFQFAVAGMRFEEMYCVVEFMRRMNRVPLKHVIIGIDPIQFGPHLPLDIRLEKTASLFNLLEESDRFYQSGLARDDFDIEGRSARLTKLTQIRYSAWDVDVVFDRITGDITTVFGRNVESLPILQYEAEKAGSDWTKQFLIANEIKHLHPRRLYYLDKLMMLAKNIGTKLTIFTNPLHPKVVAQLRERTPYIDTQNQLLAHLRTHASDLVSIYPFLTPTDFGGDDSDYFDGVHMGRHNGDCLVDYVMSRARK
jgi:fatty-acyl-CoA synthase